MSTIFFITILSLSKAEAKLVCSVKWCYVEPDGEPYCAFETENDCLKYLNKRREKGSGCELGNRCWICDQKIKCYNRP